MQGPPHLIGRHAPYPQRDILRVWHLSQTHVRPWSLDSLPSWSHRTLPTSFISLQLLSLLPRKIEGGTRISPRMNLWLGVLWKCWGVGWLAGTTLVGEGVKVRAKFLNPFSWFFYSLTFMPLAQWKGFLCHYFKDPIVPLDPVAQSAVARLFEIQRQNRMSCAVTSGANLS